jgi:hypothetical protein
LFDRAVTPIRCVVPAKRALASASRDLYAVASRFGIGVNAYGNN